MCNYSDPFGLCVLWIKWCPPRDAHYARNTRNTPLPANLTAMQNLIEAGHSGWASVGDDKSTYHRHGVGNEGNLKFVNDDGREVVYNPESGNVVDDAQNGGTYNFGVCQSFLNVLGCTAHSFADVLPYWLWGNSASDRTPVRNRVFGPDRKASGGNTWEEVNRWLGSVQRAGVPVTVRY